MVTVNALVGSWMPSSPREIEVSRPDKLLWPSGGITKRRYVDYLDAMSERMLPWLRGRPVTLIRAPDGVGGKRYFQKAVSSYAPEWIRTVRIPAPSAGRDVDFVVCDDRATLLWLGNQATLEFHPAPVRADRLDRPDLLVVDMTRGGVVRAAEVALLVLERSTTRAWRPCQDDRWEGPHVVRAERRHDADQLPGAARLTIVAARRRR